MLPHVTDPGRASSRVMASKRRGRGERSSWRVAYALCLVSACAGQPTADKDADGELADVDLMSGFEPAPRATTSAEPRSAPQTAPASSAAGAASSETQADDQGGDDQGGDDQGGTIPATEDPRVDGPAIAATTIATTVYKTPNVEGERLGYIRLGSTVIRDGEPVAGHGCKGEFYRVQPFGYVCTDEATTDLNDPLVRATRRRPDLSKPLPYPYGFVRATAPQYLRIPTYEEQKKSEFKLDDHLQWYDDNFLEVQRVYLGANDVPLRPDGMAALGVPLPPGHRLSTQLSTNELLGGKPGDGEIPFWLDGGRQIPNVSGFDVPEYAIFADRVRRKTGLSFVDAFVATDAESGKQRRFALTVDMRLVPATKVKPDTGSMFHGIELVDNLPMPLAFVSRNETTTWKLIKGRDEAKPDAGVPRRALIPLTGKIRIKAGRRFYKIARNPKRWLQADDIGVITTPPEWPEAAEAGEKWVDISLVQQTLVLYEGKRPVYATLISSGKDRLGDPESSHATPQGQFRLQSKHLAAAMDSEENSTVLGGTRAATKVKLSAEALATIDRLRKAEAAGVKLSDEDERRLINIKKGRHPEYGVTMRRGARNFELRDVPWIQYFARGYALHGAYWHDVFGTPRSHGCVNLAPIDARYVFNWTTPTVPDGWHGINVSEAFGQGTLVNVRE